MTKYSGAGIVPIILRNKRPYFVTFVDRYNTLSDAGGKIENISDENKTNENEMTEHTAVRELFEESSGLLKINNLNNLNSVHINIKCRSTYYKLYFISINSINKNHFDSNLNKFNKFKMSAFSEMYGIKLVDLDNIQFDKKDIVMKTIADETYKISYRLKMGLYQILRKHTTLYNFYNSLKIKKIKLRKKIISVTTEEYKTPEHKKPEIFTIDDIVSYQEQT